MVGLFVFSLFLCTIFTVEGELLCDTGFCTDFMKDPGCTSASDECRINNATHSGMWLPSPTLCNCCEFCLPFYGKDQYCSTGGPGTGFTVGRCGDGLTCIHVNSTIGHSYCDRMNSTCHTKQDEYDERHEAGQSFSMEMRPHCDGKGKFAAYDCIPAHTCFCQSEEGERIFGEVLNLGTVSIQNMHCGCSRLHAKISKNISPGVDFPVIGPRCTSDGNFNPVQCLHRTCYCVDKITGEIIEGDGRMVDLDEYPISELTCYDASLDLFPQYNIGSSPFNYTTPCIENMQQHIDFIKESQEAGFNVQHASSIPTCMPDGTYGRIAKKTTGESICVDERGQQIEDYEAEPNTEEALNMDCKCAKTSLVMASSVEKPVCCKNGNFRKIQCRRGLCRCVDSDGRQTEAENADVFKLSCYTSNWRTC